MIKKILLAASCMLMMGSAMAAVKAQPMYSQRFQLEGANFIMVVTNCPVCTMVAGGGPQIIYSVPVTPVTGAALTGGLNTDSGNCEYDMTSIPFKIRGAKFTMQNGTFPATLVAGPGSCASVLNVVVTRNNAQDLINLTAVPA